MSAYVECLLPTKKIIVILEQLASQNWDSMWKWRWEISPPVTITRKMVNYTQTGWATDLIEVFKFRYLFWFDRVLLILSALYIVKMHRNVDYRACLWYFWRSLHSYYSLVLYKSDLNTEVPTYFTTTAELSMQFNSEKASTLSISWINSSGRKNFTLTRIFIYRRKNYGLQDMSLCTLRARWQLTLIAENLRSYCRGSTVARSDFEFFGTITRCKSLGLQYQVDQGYIYAYTYALKCTLWREPEGRFK